MRFVKGIIKKIDHLIVEKKEFNEYLQHNKSVLQEKSTITMDNGEQLYADFDINFKEGDYIGFVVSKNNKIKYFVNELNAENLKYNRKFSSMSKFNILMQFFFIVMSIIGINNNLNVGISYFLLSSSVFLIFLNSYIYVNYKKERKNIDDYLSSIPSDKKENQLLLVKNHQYTDA